MSFDDDRDPFCLSLTSGIILGLTLQFCEKTINFKPILFDLILYDPVNNFSVMSGRVFWVEPVLNKDKCVLLKDTMQ